ncbi:hypothetical protein GCM10010222_12730 [Streptomyces tanashiensis]|uniref:hypothetical protein n=1 Tax=Streptomyces tanashiensis TaxID=67367 RepID=UPI001678BA29|nr:hypothetical protein [Streptomyces tanashiensis]GGS73277.1 hypothetical protein GCM10010222_12730 [Streptomyces tanashiensis]
MSEYNIHAGFREPQTPGAVLAEALWADLEAAFGIGFTDNSSSYGPSFTWGDGDRWLSVFVTVPPDLDEPSRSHPARITANQPDSDAWANQVFEALDATGRYSMYTIEDDWKLVRTNSELARTQWEEQQD